MTFGALKVKPLQCAIVECSATIGVVVADVAVKSANVDVIGYASPSAGTSNSNEVI